MSFKKAERFLVNPTIALTGPTGSGKTLSSLKLAAGISKAMGKPFAVVDSENGSASLYSDIIEFDTLVLTPPFTTEKFIDAINSAEKGGYCALVIDSITHAWAGEGGLLEQKAVLDSRPNTNHWTNWNPIKAKDQKFKNAYLHSSIPFLIATIRSKMEYTQTENNGKKKIEKVGMAPVQSDGIEYDFSIVFDIAMNHEAEASKDRTGLLDGKIFKITEATGELLVKWRNSGKEKPVPVVARQEAPPKEQFPDDLNQVFPPDIEDAADFVIPDEPIFGPHAGKKIREISESSLIKIRAWAEGQQMKNPLPLGHEMIADVNMMIINFLDSVGIK